MKKARMTIPLDARLIDDINRLSEQNHQSRSRIVEKAIQFWQCRQIKQALIEGYRAMAKEDLEMAEDHLEPGANLSNECRSLSPGGDLAR